MSYIIRLDDACPRRNVERWDRMEALLDKYGVKPLVGIIPNCQDPAMDIYEPDESFPLRVSRWQEKGWCLAMHGYNHVYGTKEGGINPMQARSEFAGEPLEVQKEKIRLGVEALETYLDIEPQVFFAPSHTFDGNTLKALKDYGGFYIISDTFAWDSYEKDGFTFVPQQSGRARVLPFRTCCFCYHPNTMSDDEFNELEAFLRTHKDEFIPFPMDVSHRKYSLLDAAMSKSYFALRSFKRRLRELRK